MQGEINLFKIMLESGIVVKLVLLLLVMASVMSWTIIFKKRKQLKMANLANEDFIELYQKCRTLKDVHDGCITLGEGPYKTVFVSGHREYQKLMDAHKSVKQHLQAFGLDSIKRGLERGELQAQKNLGQSLTTLASIGSVAPFIGLFGTVWGIIDSFTGLAGGSASLDAVAPGIAEALVATAVGLAAAIPAVWFFNKFSSELEGMQNELQDFGKEVLNVVERTAD